MAAAPTTSLSTLRTKIAKKLYSPSYPVVSTTTAAGTTTTVVDSVLSAAAQTEDFIGSWVSIQGATTVAFAPAVTLAEDIDTTETAWTINDDTGVTVNDYLKVDAEIVLVTAKAANVLTVTRAQLGTTASSHVNGSSCVRVTAVGGLLARVTNFTPATGTLTVAPALAAAPGSGTTYELHRKFHPTAVRDKVNEILENMRRPILLPLTQITDGDMELSTTTSFSASASATFAKDTSNVLHSRQSLNVLSWAQNEIVTSTPTVARHPEPGSSVLVQADIYLGHASDDVTMDLRDLTNGATVDLARAVRRGWQTLSFIVDVPATAEDLSVRFTNNRAATTSTVYIGNIILLQVDDKIFDYPASLEWSEDLIEVFYLPIGNELTLTNASNAFRVREGPSQKWGEASILRNDASANAFMIELRSDKEIDRALWVQGRVDYGTLTADADTTFAPEDIIVFLSAAELLEEWADELDLMSKPEIALKKVARADKLRQQISVQLRKHSPDKGVVQGTIREKGKR